MQIRLALLSAVIAGAAMVAHVPADAQDAEIRSDFCRKAYNDLASKPKPRAMALSRDGKFCHSAWGGNASQRQTDLNAINGCARSGQACRVVRR